jgi:hypothetical protein
MGELVDSPDEAFTAEYVLPFHPIPNSILYVTFSSICDPLYRSRERREHQVFRKLLNLVPGLEERLMEGSEEETRMVADLVCRVDISCCWSSFLMTATSF